MKKHKKGHRLLSLGICLCMLLGASPMSGRTLAADEENDADVTEQTDGEVSGQMDNQIGGLLRSVQGDFIITLTESGGDPQQGTDYEYSPGVLRILSSTPMTIQNKDQSTAAQDCIVVENGVSADITLDKVTIANDDKTPFEMAGATVELRLKGESYLKSDNRDGFATLHVPEGANLTISDAGNGSLTSYGYDSAGIGSNEGEDGGTILISGGIVKGECSRGGAGIGGSSQGNSGFITIDGGNVTGISGRDGAGIGGGGQGAGTEITVNGGTVTAKSYSGAGIGGGAQKNSGIISIHGGTVTAESTGGAAIGGGESGGCGDKIIIDGTAKVVCESNGGAGIGGGSSSSSGNGGDGGTIIIEGEADVTARGTGQSAGIGGGGGAGREHGGNGGIIRISGGKVNATGGYLAAGIGGGSPYGNSGDITIEDGIITAESFSDRNSRIYSSGAGIGGANLGSTDTITIKGGTVSATSRYYGAGIGGGALGNGGNIKIEGGTVNAYGNYGAGIGGGGYSGSFKEDTTDGTVCGGGNVTVTGGTITASGAWGAAIGGGCNFTADDSLRKRGNGGTVSISGTGTFVSAIAASGRIGYDIGGGLDGTGLGGTLTVFDGAVLTMGNHGTNANMKDGCIGKSTIIDNSTAGLDSEWIGNINGVYSRLEVDNGTSAYQDGQMSWWKNGIVKSGVQVEITENVPAGKDFGYWTAEGIDLTDAGKEELTFDFKMPENDVKIAAYILKDFAVTLTADPADGGKVTGDGIFREGTVHKVSAAAEEGYEFEGWFENGTEVSTQAQYEFTVQGDRSLTARFKKLPEPHTHTFGTEWKSDAEHHWHECTAGDQAKSDLAGHIPGDWMIDKEATENEPGSRHKECTICKYVTETGEIEKIPAAVSITGLPKSYTLELNQSVSWKPEPAGGTWSYDKDYLKMDSDGKVYSFKAVKTGKTKAVYTAGGASHTIDIEITKSASAQKDTKKPGQANSGNAVKTGDTENLFIWMQVLLFSLLACAAAWLYKKRHRVF